ncbi:hypothetical protein Btru_000686 [Bulinus truncatus]|nr:hypothetical protein Btru_000686 [Bulinus truncatus]
MTVRNELNHHGLPLHFEKQIQPADDDDDDEDNNFIISLEDNGEEEGLLCDPEEIDFGGGKPTLDLFQANVNVNDGDSAIRVYKEDSSFLTFSTKYTNDVPQNGQSAETSISLQSLVSSPCVPYSPDYTVSQSNYSLGEGHTESPSAPQATVADGRMGGLNVATQPVSPLNNLSISGVETVHLDAEAGGIWSEAIFLSTSLGAFAANNSNCSSLNSSNETGFQPSCTELPKCLPALTHPNELPGSAGKIQVSNLSGSSPQGNNVLAFPVKLASPSSTVYTVPKLSGPFPRNDTISVHLEDNLKTNLPGPKSDTFSVHLGDSLKTYSVLKTASTINDNAVVCQGDSCSCIMCYKGRGVKDPDSLVDQFSLEANRNTNLMKRKISQNAMECDETLRPVAKKQFTNLSSLICSLNQSNNTSLKNITLRGLISSPPLTTSVTTSANSHSQLHKSMESVSGLVTTLPLTTSKSALTTKVFLSPREVPMQKGIIPTTVVTSASVSTTVSTCESNKLTTILSSPKVTTAVTKPLPSARSVLAPGTLVYLKPVKSDTFKPQSEQLGNKWSENCKLKAPVIGITGATQKDLESTREQNSLVQTSSYGTLWQASSVANKILVSNCPFSSSSEKNDHNNILPKAGNLNLDLPLKVSTDQSPPAKQVCSSKPTVLTSPPKDTIYTRSLLKTNLLSPKSLDSVVPSKISPPLGNIPSMQPETASFSNAQYAAATTSERKKILLDLITKHLHDRTLSSNGILQTLLKDSSLISNSSYNQNQVQTDSTKTVHEQRLSPLKTFKSYNKICDPVSDNELVTNKCSAVICSPQPPEERIPKSYIQDWVNKAQTLTCFNLKHGEYLDDVRYLEQSTDDDYHAKCVASPSKPIVDVKEIDIKPLNCLNKKQIHNSLLVSVLEQNRPNKPGLQTPFATSDQHASIDKPTFHQPYTDTPSTAEATDQYPAVSVSCSNTAGSNRVSGSQDFLEYSQHSSYSSYSTETSHTLNKKLVKEEHRHNSVMHNFRSVDESYNGSSLTAHNNMGYKKLKKKHSSTVISSSNGLKLKIKLSDPSASNTVNRKHKDPLISKVSDSASKLAVSGEESSKCMGSPANETLPTPKVNAQDTTDKVETAEEMFQRFQEQAMQEVLKAQMGKGMICRSLRPTRPNVSFLEKYPGNFALKRKKTDVEKMPVTKVDENSSIKSDSNVTLDKETNTERKKKRHLSVESEPIKQLKPSTLDYPKLRQDTSITNRKKIYCTNILAGHKVYVKFNVFENIHNGRSFLVPFFNIGGSRTQFDVEDIEYISKAVVEYDKEERSCARHLLFYAREGNKATFLRKETNLINSNISEKSYKKCSYVLEGFQRSGSKKTEPVVDQWKLDNSVSIEIDRAEVDDDAEKHFAEMMGCPVNEATSPAHFDNGSANKTTVEDAVTKVAELESLQNVASHEVPSRGYNESSVTYTDVLKKLVIAEHKQLSPIIIKKEPEDNGYEASFNFPYICSEQMSTPANTLDVHEVHVKQEVLDDFVTTMANCGTPLEKPGSLVQDISVCLTAKSVVQESNSTLSPVGPTAVLNSASDVNCFLELNKTNAVDVLQNCEVSKNPTEGNVSLEPSKTLVAEMRKDPEPSISDINDEIFSSVENSDSDDNSDHIEQPDPMMPTGDTLGNACDDFSSSNSDVHPVQNKISSLVQSLRQRLAQSSSIQPSWLAGEQSQITQTKTRHKKSTSKEIDLVKSSHSILPSDKTVGDNVTCVTSLLTSLTGTTLSSVSPVRAIVQSQSSDHISNSSDIADKQLTGSPKSPLPAVNTTTINPTGIPTSCPEGITASHTVNSDNNVVSIKFEIVEGKIENCQNSEETRTGGTFSEVGLDKLADTVGEMSTNNQKTLPIIDDESDLVDLESKELPSIYCLGTKIKSERSTPSDFEIEVGTEDINERKFRPISTDGILSPNELTWKHFSKPYSILLSKESKLSSAHTTLDNHFYSKTNITSKNKRIQKKNLKRSKESQENPDAQTSECDSVTSYLCKKFSQSSSKIKGPRLLLNASNNKLCPKPKTDAVSIQAIPEPISTAELSKTPSLIEIFGIDVIKESTPLSNNNGIKQEETPKSEPRRSSNIARKRTTKRSKCSNAHSSTSIKSNKTDRSNDSLGIIIAENVWDQQSDTVTGPVSLIQKCYVRLKRLDMTCGTVKLCDLESSKNTDVSPNVGALSTISSRKKSMQRSVKRQKKKSRGGQRTVPPKKDIVDYYAYMIESLQKKAQLLEEASKKEKEQKMKKEIEELAKKAEEKTGASEINRETEDPSKMTSYVLENLQNELEDDLRENALNEVETVDLEDKNSNEIPVNTDDLKNCENVMGKVNKPNDTLTSQNKDDSLILSEVDLLPIDYESYPTKNNILETYPIDSSSVTFEKKDIVLCGNLDEDVLKFSASDKQRLAAEEDLLLAPSINFDDDDDMISMMPVDVEKLLGLESDSTVSSNFILDATPEHIKDNSMLGSEADQVKEKTISETGKNSFPDNKHLPCTPDMETCPSQNNTSEWPQPLHLWKNIPEPGSDKSSTFTPSQPPELSSHYLRNLKFKLKSSTAALIRSIKASKEINKVFGENSSEGNSPTEETQQDSIKLFSQTSGQQACSNIFPAKLPLIPKLKLRKETLEAIQKDKIQFNLNGKGGEEVLNVSESDTSVITEKLNEQIAEDTKFYLRHSKEHQQCSSLITTSLDARLEVGGSSESKLILTNCTSQVEKTPPDHEETSESYSSENKEKCNNKKEGIFYNVQQFADSENASSKSSVETLLNLHKNADKKISNPSVKCNLNIDLFKSKLKLDPSLLWKKDQSVVSKVESTERPEDNHSPETDKGKIMTAASSSKSLPALNTTKLCNILKNLCRQTPVRKRLRSSPRKRSPSKMTARNQILSHPDEGQERSLRSKSKKQPCSPIKKFKRSGPVKEVHDSSDLSKASTEKEDAKGRSFFDCLQNVNDVIVSDCIEKKEVQLAGFLEMSELLARITLWLMASYYGVRVLLFILVKCWANGVRRVFQSKPVSARPPVLDDPALGTHGFLRLEDVQIHYVVSGPEDRPLMLFVHGFPEFWYSWRHQIREFQKDYRVVAVDQRGYGDSSKPTEMTEYCTKKLMGDLQQVIIALGYKRCVLVGHDWGGVVCWAFGRRFPDMVDRLVILNSPPSPIVMRVMQKEKKQMAWYMLFFQLPWLPEFYCKMCNFELFDNLFGNKFIGNMGFPKAFVNPLKQKDVDAYKYTFSQPGTITPPINYYRALFRFPVGQVDYDMDFTIPVLVVWGVEDVALSLGIVEVIENEHPKIAVRRIEEAGHFVQMDRPDLVNKAIRDWLSE